MAEDHDEYRPDHSGMYELEFPAPQLSSADGRGPVMIHALEGFSDAGHAIRLSAKHLRDSLDTELVASFAIDELLDYRSRRPLMTFKTDHFTTVRRPRAEPVRAARQRRNTVSAAGRHGAGPEVGALHHRRPAAGRAPRGTPDHRLGHHPDGCAAHPASDDDRARQQQGADHRASAVGRRGPGAREVHQTSWNTAWLSTATKSSVSPCTSRITSHRPTTPRPPRRCSPRSARSPRCRYRWPRWAKPQPRSGRRSTNRWSRAPRWPRWWRRWSGSTTRSSRHKRTGPYWPATKICPAARNSLESSNASWRSSPETLGGFRDGDDKN